MMMSNELVKVDIRTRSASEVRREGFNVQYSMTWSHFEFVSNFSVSFIISRRSSSASGRRQVGVR